MSIRLFIVPALAAFLAGCGDHSDPHSHTGAKSADDGHGAKAAADPHAGHDHGPSTGIALPDTVQQNLGITWATAEYRVVQGVLRMPGRFEAEPSARRAYHVPFAGRVEVLVRPYQSVALGDPLYRLESPAWQALQQGLAEGNLAGAAARNLAAGERHVDALKSALSAWTQRVEVLERLDRELGGKAAERAETATRVADLTVQLAQAERDLLRLQREAAGPDGSVETGMAAVRVRQMFAQVSAITGLTRAELEAQDEHGVPRWLAIEAPVVRALANGVVEGEVLSNGAWIAEHTTVLTITDPSGVRLRAAGLQADLPRLREGLQARIVAADPAGLTALSATLMLGPVADAADRTVTLIARPVTTTGLPVWVRPGVTANLEVVISGSPEEELAIPVASTIRDGLKTMYFRRDPTRPGQVTKVEADLGPSDGRWVVVQSGLKEGDQVVLGGIYPLKLSQQEGGAQAGHFEADGTFHTGKH